MRKDQLVFLIGGLAFGFLVGFGVYHVRFTEPDPARAAGAAGAIAGPRGPAAPTEGGPSPGPGAAPAGGGGPMVAEINELKRRLQQEPNDFRALVRLANLHHDVSMWPQAVEYYERALAIEPSNPDLLTDLGICYRGLGRFDDAIAVFERARQADPRHWQSLYNLVVVAGLDLGDYARAERALDDLAALDPAPPRLDELRRAVEERRAAGRP